MPHHTKQKMLDIPQADRPREKLLTVGPKNLSETELIAILLGTGVKGKNAIAVSDSLLRQFPLAKLPQTPFAELKRFSGVGMSKAARIAAALELGERAFAPQSFTKVTIRSTQDALTQLRDIAEKKQEYLVVLYINARYELLQKEVVGVGTLNHMKITPKEIFSHALQTPCASIIVAHNHPSGDPTPSDDDIMFTSRIHEAGEVMGIPMLDHLVVSKGGYYSFRDNGGR